MNDVDICSCDDSRRDVEIRSYDDSRIDIDKRSCDDRRNGVKDVVMITNVVVMRVRIPITDM